MQKNVLGVLHLITRIINSRQFLQSFGAKRKCDGAESLAQKLPFSSTNLIVPNYNTVCFTDLGNLNSPMVVQF
jgi:hypothetical protein